MVAAWRYGAAETDNKQERTVTHYNKFFDKSSLGAWDLDGKDRIVTIESVKPGKVGGQQGRKEDRKPIIMFKGKRKRFICNATNAKIIASLYGNHVEKWVDQRIILYPTETTFGRETVECIRVRPFKPGDSAPDTTDTLDREPESADEAAQ